MLMEIIHWQHILLVSLFVIHGYQNEVHNICSQGNMEDDQVKLNLTTYTLNETCCCHLQVITSGSIRQVQIFLEYDCTITFTEGHSWLSGIKCNQNGQWLTSVINQENDICVIRNGVKTRPGNDTLHFRNSNGGHSSSFRLSCNGSITTTPTTTVLESVTTTPLKFSATSTMEKTTSGPTEMTTINDREESEHLPVAAIIGATLAAVVIIIVIAVVLFLFHRKRNTKQPPLDNVSERYGSDLFTEDNNEVVMRNNSLYISSGVDNSGYYEKTSANRTSSQIRVPKKQLFKGDVYSEKHVRTNSEKDSGSSFAISVHTSPEDASFVY